MSIITNPFNTKEETKNEAPEMAFASVGVVPHPKVQGQAIAVIQTGMTLRDYFAGQCLTCMVDEGNMTEQEIAQWCYLVADKMMEVRKPKKQ